MRLMLAENLEDKRVREEAEKLGIKICQSLSSFLEGEIGTSIYEIEQIYLFENGSVIDMTEHYIELYKINFRDKIIEYMNEAMFDAIATFAIDKENKIQIFSTTCHISTMEIKELQFDDIKALYVISPVPDRKNKVSITCIYGERGLIQRAKIDHNFFKMLENNI